MEVIDEGKANRHIAVTSKLQFKSFIKFSLNFILKKFVFLPIGTKHTCKVGQKKKEHPY